MSAQYSARKREAADAILLRKWAAETMAVELNAKLGNFHAAIRGCCGTWHVLRFPDGKTIHVFDR